MVDKTILDDGTLRVEGQTDDRGRLTIGREVANRRVTLDLVEVEPTEEKQTAD